MQKLCIGRKGVENTMSPPVLVVDDDDGIRQLLTIALDRAGVTVDTASNGCAALEMIGARDYAVVILDMMMPCVDGWAVLRRLAREQPRPAVIVTSAVADDENVPGADVVLPKPFDLLVLIRTVKGLLSAGSHKLSA